MAGLTARPVVLVGATGYLGRILLARLTAAGESVVSFGRTDPMIAQVLHVHLQLEDAGAIEAIAPMLRDMRPRAIIAAHSAPPEAGTAQHQRVTLSAATAFLALAAKLPECRFIGFGSAAEYGVPGSALALGETSPRVPVSAYGHAKSELMDAIAQAAARGQDAVGLRLFSLIGGQMPERTLLGTVQRQLDAGLGGAVVTGALDGARDFLPVGAAATAVLGCVDGHGLPSCINLGSGRATPLRALLNEVLAQDTNATGRPWHLRETGPRGALQGYSLAADVSVARKLGLVTDAPDLATLAALVRGPKAWLA